MEVNVTLYDPDKVVAKAKSLEDCKIAVTEAGYDDIGAVLNSMGITFQGIRSSNLRNFQAIEGFDIIFVNCRSGLKLGGWRFAKPVRRFVSKGGTIYLSDYAFTIVKAAFPDTILFSAYTGSSGHRKAQVVDKELAKIIGERITLHFDMSAWVEIRQVNGEAHSVDGVKVSLARAYLKDDWWPFLVSFDYGQGTVIYTSFHNHAQASEKEMKLIKYLALKPVAIATKSSLMALYDQYAEE